MSECILVFRGYARDPGWCHVVVARDDRGQQAVLVGELEDNPGTSVTNAIEQVAESIERAVLEGDAEFELYEYIRTGLPDLEPTFSRVQWGGRPGQFTDPTWHRIEPESDARLRVLRKHIRENDYTAQALIRERGLSVVDARDREDLPSAI